MDKVPRTVLLSIDTLRMYFAESSVVVQRGTAKKKKKNYVSGRSRSLLLECACALFSAAG